MCKWKNLFYMAEIFFSEQRVESKEQTEMYWIRSINDNQSLVY